MKAAGINWVLFRPKGRREHRRQLGLLAPADAIASAQIEAATTASRRDRERVASTRQRDKNEARYRAEFEDAVMQWLSFSSEHAAMARTIAQGAVDRAAVVGSGRVGRTKTVSLEDPRRWRRGRSSVTAFLDEHRKPD